MKRFAPFTICLALAVWASPTLGQGARATAGRVVAPAGTQVIRVPASQLANGTVPGNVRVAQNASVESLLNGYPAPGLGFDYTHHAAVNRNLATRALIDPLTQQRLNQAMQLRRNTPQGPIAFPAVVNNIQIVVMAPPAVVILPVADEQDEASDRSRRRSRRDEEEYFQRMNERYAPALQDSQKSPATAPAPPREVSELVLIRRDGTVLFAVGYTMRGDRMIYITRDGHRNSLSLALLDLEATREMNESLGTTLQL